MQWPTAKLRTILSRTSCASTSRAKHPVTASGGILLLGYNYHTMDNSFLEHYYETAILPQYTDVHFETIAWKDHGKVGLDTWAHYFEDQTGREYVLLYEDFPTGEYLNDDLSHEVIPSGNQPSIQVALSTDKKIENLVGFFTLYKEIR